MTCSRQSWIAAVATALTLSAVAASEAQPTRINAPAPPLRTDAIARVANLRTSAVVAVHTVTPEFTVPGLPLARPGEEGLGSGVVIDANGLILTNAHVIDGADVIHIRTADGDDIKATVVGIDSDVDLALLRAADARGLQPAPLGDSDRLRVGDWVVAIGNPLGLHHTVTAGIVSAKARTLDDSGVEYLQTDAAVSPGSSGGPLLDLSGRVVGINVGILSANRQNVGLNVAIPVSAVKEVLPRLRSGATAHGWIGVMTTALTASSAAARGLSSGLVLTAVTNESPAKRAGLQAGDVVIGFADDPATTLRDFYPRVRSLAPGSILRLTVWRNRERLVVPVEVTRRPPLRQRDLPLVP